MKIRICSVFLALILLISPTIACGNNASIQAENDRLAAEQAASEQASRDKADAEQAEADRLAAEQAAKEQAEADRIAAEKAAAEKRSQEAFDNAKIAYEALCEAAEITNSVMSSVYGAWYFGIYKAKDSTTATVLTNLAKEVRLTKSELSAGLTAVAKEFSMSESTILWAMVTTNKDISNYVFCLDVVDFAYKINGTYDEIQKNIDAANAVLKKMTAEFDDYKHYPTLKEFYSKVLSYAEFAQSPTGSFQQLSPTKAEYENSIRTYRIDLSFVFE